mmetsp:Transcript_30748/g.57304  ORF Transcript_30748/g.57304 Transcript_30748/m.57304 type:complete len:88 (+) Transcript_30748:875-1138(+)
MLDTAELLSFSSSYVCVCVCMGVFLLHSIAWSCKCETVQWCCYLFASPASCYSFIPVLYIVFIFLAWMLTHDGCVHIGVIIRIYALC